MTADQPIRVLSVDDHPTLSEGIATMIHNEPDMKLVATASTGSEGILKYREFKPDITLMDLRLPDLSGIDVILAILSECMDARIIVLTMSPATPRFGAMEAGAQGYLLKDMPPQEMVRMIRQVHAGKGRVLPEIASRLAEHAGGEVLTDRELEVLRHLAAGDRNHDIARRLGISEETVQVHIRHIMEKLGATGRTQAIAIAVRRGFIHL